MWQEHILPFLFQIKAAIHTVKNLNDIGHRFALPMYIWIVIIKWYRKKVGQRNAQMECHKKHLPLVWFTENVIRLGTLVCVRLCVFASLYFMLRMFLSGDEICNFNYRTGITHYADWIDRQQSEWTSVCVEHDFCYCVKCIISWHQSVQMWKKAGPKP